MSRQKANLRALKLETLEGRSLMAADIFLSNEVLAVHGTTGNDIVTVTEVAGTGNGWEPAGPATTLRVAIQNRQSGQMIATQEFSRAAVKSIVMNGDVGHDLLINQTDKPSVLIGGGGVDDAVGGSGADWVSMDVYLSNPQANDSQSYGMTLHNGMLVVPTQGDISRVDIALVQMTGTTNPVTKLQVTYTYHWGYVQSAQFDPALVKHIVFIGTGANETVNNRTAIPSIMYGGAGVDDLTGGSANDLIFGGDGNDYLYGNLGADRLFGGNNDDFLAGGVAGDTAVDYLYGESGADEFAPGLEDVLDFRQSDGDIRRRK